MRKAWRWFKQNWKQTLVGSLILYSIHLYVEAVIITNALAIAGLKLPVFV